MRTCDASGGRGSPRCPLGGTFRSRTIPVHRSHRAPASRHNRGTPTPVPPRSSPSERAATSCARPPDTNARSSPLGTRTHAFPKPKPCTTCRPQLWRPTRDGDGQMISKRSCARGGYDWGVLQNPLTTQRTSKKRVTPTAARNAITSATIATE